MIDTIKKLKEHMLPSRDDLICLIDKGSNDDWEELFSAARETCLEVYGKGVFVRGLIEFTSYCKNDCFYCGLRHSNANAARFRLTCEEILSCCQRGFELGFMTFVLQGGEDLFFSGEKICEIVAEIKRRFPDCAVTLSLGERSPEDFQLFFAAGADRYLLRHETIDPTHYSKLHPKQMSYVKRLECLNRLKEIGFQVGCGFMVGSPYQTTACLAEELAFLKKFRPHMVGIGPFLAHSDTPFADRPNGSAELTLKMLALVRLVCPETLLPATTALGTAIGDGRERGILAGANVVMPNLSPAFAREKYTLYNNKLNTGAESAEGICELERKLNSVGRKIVANRGDSRVL